MLRIISGVCGIISQLVGLTAIVASVSNSPWFNWKEEYISVLGVAGTAIGLFNYGLVLMGTFSLVFAFGLGKNLVLSKVGRLGILSLILGSIALFAMGIFPPTIYLAHNLASMAFFTFVPLALFLVGVVAMKASQIAWGVSSFTAGTLIGTFQVVPWPWSGGAIPQLLSCLPWSFWMVGSGLKLLIRTSLGAV